MNSEYQTPSSRPSYIFSNKLKSPTSQEQIFFDLTLYVPVNILSVMSGRVFLGWTSTM